MLLAMQHDRLITMIKESITLMCKSTLMYSNELCVEGLLGITLDKRDVFLVNIKEIFQSDNPPPPSVSSSNVTDVSHDTMRDDLQVISDGETGKFQHEPPRKVAKHIHRQTESNIENSFQVAHQSEVEHTSRVAFDNSMAQLTSCVETLTSATTTTSEPKFPSGIVIKEEVQDIDFGHENTSESTVIRDARLSAAVNQSFSSAPFTSTPYHTSMYSSAVSPSAGSTEALDTRFSLPVKTGVDPGVVPGTTNGVHSSQFILSGLDFATEPAATSNRALVSDSGPHPPDDIDNTKVTFEIAQPDHNLHAPSVPFDQTWHDSLSGMTRVPGTMVQCWLEKLPKRPSPSTGKLVQVHWDCDVCSDRKLDRRRRSQWCCGLCRRGVCPNECFKKHVLMRDNKFTDPRSVAT